MHVTFFLVVLLVTSINAERGCKDSNKKQCDYCLKESDFNSGTYRIKESGLYCFIENIIFNPIPGNPSNPNDEGSWFPRDNNKFPGCIDQFGGGWSLGFFAAISIETNNVFIDLNGYQISMDFQFYVQQRFFSLIEIASLPFIPNAGPADWGNDFVNVKNIEIRNGEMGLTSHIAIHSNNATNIIIENLKIFDFEVAAIQLNGFQNVELNNIEIGPSFQSVPISAYYSNARFLLLALRHLLGAIKKDKLKMAKIPFSYLADGKSLTLQQIHDNLVESMDMLFRDLIGDLSHSEKNSELYEKTMNLFGNKEGLPDGSAIYGIILNSFSDAVKGFGDSLNNGDRHGSNIKLKNININDLKLNVNEIPAIYFNECDDGKHTHSETHNIQKGPFGDIMDIRKMIDAESVALIENFDISNGDLSSLQYIGNVVSDAQIALFLYGTDYIGDDINYSFTSFISDYLIEWAVKDKNGNSNILPSCTRFVCNGDIMFHTNKGVMGLRMDGIEDVTLDGISISNLENRSPLVSFACGSYEGPHDGAVSGTRAGEGGMGTDIKGLSITDSEVVLIGTNKINNLETYFGDNTGIHLMEGSILDFEPDSNIDIDSLNAATGLTMEEYIYLKSIHKTPYPNNFDLCSIRIEDDSTIINGRGASLSKSKSKSKDKDKSDSSDTTSLKGLLKSDCVNLFNLE